jgi:hypothetical protein
MPTYIHAGDGDVDDSSLGELEGEDGAGLDGLAELDGGADVDDSAADDMNLKKMVLHRWANTVNTLWL